MAMPNLSTQDMKSLPIRLLLAGLLLVGAVAHGQAQEGWTPFKDAPGRTTQKRPVTEPKAAPPWPEAAPSGRPGEEALPQAQGPYQRPQARPSPVERMDLDPVMAGDASGLPLELWRGLDMQGLETLLGALELPPRSPVLHGLWRRMLLSAAPPPAGVPADHFLAVRLEALYRSGMLAEMGEAGAGGGGPVVSVLMARRDIGLGDAQKGCDYIKSLADPRSGLPERLKGEVQLLVGYCAAVGGDRSGAGLAASLAREEGLEAELPLAVLTGVAEESKPSITLPKRGLLLDYRFLELLGPVNTRQLVERAEPALLAVIAQDARADAVARIHAAESALRSNVLSPSIAGEILRQVDVGQGEVDPAVRRAQQLKAAGNMSSPASAGALNALLREARRTGAGLQVAQALAANFAGGRYDPGLAEIAVEALLAAGEISEARQAAGRGQHGLPHWVALIEVVDPARKTWRPSSLSILEELAVRGSLDADGLHRLATVLDALDIDVPVPLWDAANRAPQPKGGYLPETGVLAELAQSAQRKDTGRTILLVMRALGPQGAEGANILPLGDAIRALRKIGLETEARRLALEALLPVWPRFGAR